MQLCDGPIVAFTVLHNVNCCRGLIYVTSQVKCHLDAFFNIILSMLLCVCPHHMVALTKEVWVPRKKKSMWNNHPCPYKIAQYYQFFQRAGSGSVAITALLNFILLRDAINRKTLWNVQIWRPGVYILVLHTAKKLYCFSFGFWNYELWVQGFLKICQLPSAYNYDNYWPVQKVKLIFMSTCFTLTICSIVYLIQKFFFFFFCAHL